MPPTDPPLSPASPSNQDTSALARFDQAYTANPWYPRTVPYFLYVLFLWPIGWLGGWSPAMFIPAYVIQCSLVAWLLYRSRGWLPELNLRFHWLAIPAAVGLTIAWVGLGHAMDHLWPAQFDQTDKGTLFEQMRHKYVAVFWVAVALKYIGMSLVVPLFEELFIRSAILRGTHSARQTGIGLVQLAVDFPLLGDWLMDTRLGRWATAQPEAFTAMLTHTPVGILSIFSVIASTAIFSLGHHPRDWPGAVVCGLVWCALLWYTNRGNKKQGLGPIVWSHGLTNALLLTYVLWSGDWQFI